MSEDEVQRITDDEDEQDGISPDDLSPFVHPAEASHGDLGMIVAGDSVLALSNSGETPELADLVEHSRRFALPLVAISGRGESSMRSAHHCATRSVSSMLARSQ